MPTPIQHLVMADDILADAALLPTARERLIAQRGAFLLGTIAPDVQSVSGQTREAPHFFTPPLTDLRPAHEVMLVEDSQLARANKLPPAQAAFIAGYIQHVTLDELWSEHVSRILESPDDMQRRVFAHLSPGSIPQFYADARLERVCSIEDYLGGV